VLDSPLTSYKEGKDAPVDAQTSEIDPTIQNGFWTSLLKLPENIQIVVFDNKEPPQAVASAIEYTFFAGRKAEKDQRRGFIPSR
jgi:hypothetical protein